MGMDGAIERMVESGEMSCGCGCGHGESSNWQTIAIATVPCQKWSEPYDLAKALKEGTIFPELNKPFYMGGDDNVR